jgi:rare lipoprotein A
MALGLEETQTGGTLKLKSICWCCLISCVLACGAKGTTDPLNESRRSVQYGVASWYGGRFQGRVMASGKPFDQELMTAAHRTLPLGSRVEVTNLSNGLSVVVRVMDRGPYVAGRTIDLSKAAANLLGFTSRGLARVRIRLLRTSVNPAKGAGLHLPPQRAAAQLHDGESRSNRAYVASR